MIEVVLPFDVMWLGTVYEATGEKVRVPEDLAIALDLKPEPKKAPAKKDD